MDEFRVHTTGVSLEDEIDLETNRDSHINRTNSGPMLGSKKNPDEKSSRKARLTTMSGAPRDTSEFDLDDLKSRYLNNSKTEITSSKIWNDEINDAKTEGKSQDNSLRSSPSSKIDRLFPTLTPQQASESKRISKQQENWEKSLEQETNKSVEKSIHEYTVQTDDDLRADDKITMSKKRLSSNNIKIKTPLITPRKNSKEKSAGKAFTAPKSVNNETTVMDDEKTVNLNNENKNPNQSDIKKESVRHSTRKSHRKSVNIATMNRPIERLEYLLGHGTEKKSENVQWYEADASSFYQPTPEEPISVAMNVSVLNLADIDTAKMSYRMKLEIWVAWPLTEAEVKSYYENPDDWKPYIHPEPVPSTITIESSEKMKFLSGRTTQLFLWRGKFVACECTLVTATYLEYMELVNFPFDCQHFHFKIGIRSDCDIPLKVVNDKVILTNLHAIGGFSSSDGRAMSQVNFDERACYFNVKSHMLTLKDFTLEGIECEIENTGEHSDTPFFHCALRMSRNYAFYVFRIFVPIFLIMISSTLVFRFGSQILDARLSYIVINMLTIVAFFFIISSILPLIPYLTFIDKYMNMALLYIVGVGIVCVIFSEFSLENTRTEDAVFATCLSFLLLTHLLMGVFCMHIRRVEFYKTTINRHQVDEMENSRILNAWCTQEKVDKGEEFIVHTDLHPYDGDYNVYEGCERVNEIADSSVSKLGWLFDEVEDDDDYQKEIQESEVIKKATNVKKTVRRMTATILPFTSKSSSPVGGRAELKSPGKPSRHKETKTNRFSVNFYRDDSQYQPATPSPIPVFKKGKTGKFKRHSSILNSILGSDSNMSSVTDVTSNKQLLAASNTNNNNSSNVNQKYRVSSDPRRRESKYDPEAASMIQDKVKDKDNTSSPRRNSKLSSSTPSKRKSILKNFTFHERKRKSVNRGSIATEYV